MTIFLICHKKLKNNCSTLDLNSKPFNEKKNHYFHYTTLELS